MKRARVRLFVGRRLHLEGSNPRAKWEACPWYDDSCSCCERAGYLVERISPDPLESDVVVIKVKEKKRKGEGRRGIYLPKGRRVSGK